jgi:hydrogenase maturation protein HypF
MTVATHCAEEVSGPGEAIRVRGLVQGVGFRPTVWRLARDCGLAGDVRNDAEGVLIQVWGDPEARRRFVGRLHREAPPLSRIDALESAPLQGAAPGGQFRIIASRTGAVRTGVVPDAATCDDCVHEILDTTDRRNGYAFTNCTHCGPRLSIVQRIPYDRGNTSMAKFAMCPTCRREYHNPADRRFHAQPNACRDCGPRLWLECAPPSRASIDGDPIEVTRRLLQNGYIVAIKGIGGFHLACDATNAEAVARLRVRKQRSDKPFALMARDEDVVRRYCNLTQPEAALLHSTAAPIVLMHAHGRERLAEGVAPGQRCFGLMLPYSPLHHLIMAGFDVPIVLTSGNHSEEPQCIGNDEGRKRLAGIADAFLLHDRDIVNRVDDSVTRLISDAPAVLRRARGYAPAPLLLPPGFNAATHILACGGEIKNTFCLLKDGNAILSQHLGDLENASANAAYRQTLELYLELFGHRPRVLAIDAHPDYLSSKFGRERAAGGGCRLITVQHHHAHVAACLAENGVELDADPVVGLALDGIGYGDDGTLWGGEFLLVDYRGYRRLAAFAPVPMPGGTQAIREPWRMAYAHLTRACEWSRLESEYAGLPFFRALTGKPLRTLNGMMASGFNSPMTSSCGRLFDAVAAVVGLRQIVSYEAQAAIELEAAVDPDALLDEGYPFALTIVDALPRLDAQPMWDALLQDLHAGCPIGSVAARFHTGLARALVRMLEHLATGLGEGWTGRIALSGGVFQNATLSAELIRRLEAKGLQVLRHSQVPANDGNLSLGQAVVAAARMIE